MATTYRIEGVLAPDGYKSIIFLAYLFRVVPDIKVLNINTINVANIYTPNIGTGPWSYVVIGGQIQITLNMRKIFTELPNYGNWYLGRIMNINEPSVIGSLSYIWYYAMCMCDPILGIPSYACAQKGICNPITVTIDDSNLNVNEPWLEDNAVFGLSQTSYCDANGNLIRRTYPDPLYLTV